MMLRWEIVFMRSPLTQYDELLNVVYEASGATTDERVLRPAHTTPNAGNTNENQCRAGMMSSDLWSSLSLKSLKYSTPSKTNIF